MALNLLDRNWWSFLWRYRRGKTPWDTQITPPEVAAFLDTTTAGRALDLGCGTGTNAITMAERGWHVTGIDFIPNAIAQARQKATRKHLMIQFQVGDVSDLSQLKAPYDYVLDIGCLHALSSDRQKKYANGLKRLIANGGTYMLYAWMPRVWKGKDRGISAGTVQSLFTPQLHLEHKMVGEEAGGPSAWYWFKKPPNSCFL